MFLTDCSGVSGTPGVYSIQVDHDNSVQAACLEGGWTVIQSRGQYGNPSDYFNKGWAEYKAGFGTPGKEHWLGLQNIFQLTNRPNVKMQLKIDMERFSGQKATVNYDHFYLETQTHYRLKLGKFHGDIYDSLGRHRNSEFSTKDHGTATNSHHPSVTCANRWRSGWWYTNCHHAHLNGINYGSAITISDSMSWRMFGYSIGVRESLKTITMSIKPQ